MKKVGTFFRDCLFLLVGLTVSTFLISFAVASIPVYVYRWFVCKALAPIFRPRIGKAVTSFGVAFGTDYASKDFHKRHSRSTLLTTMTLDGTVEFKQFFEVIRERWIEAKKSSDGALLYPEFQQYVESWMGFLFWKQDEEFDLRNHVKFHKIRESATEKAGKEYVTQTVEYLLNKPFPLRRSPWEMHVIQGYHNKDLRSSTKAFCGSGDDSGRMTVVLFRNHHALADGFSILHELIEGILGTPMTSVLSAYPSDSRPKQTVLNGIWSCMQFTLRLFYDIGAAFGNALKPQMKSPWHAPDGRKRWRNLHERSGLIPVGKVVFIKNKFGVSFTSVLYSCMGAALAKNLAERKMDHKTEEFREAVKHLPVSAVLPLLPRPRDKLRNYLTVTLVDLPISYRLGLKERLIQSKRSYVQAKTNTIPYFFPYVVQVVGSHLAVVANLLFDNQVISGGLSNVLGPMVPVSYQGCPLLTAGFAFGNLRGVAGVGFQILSYAGFLSFGATVEEGVMGRKELTQLLQYACQELDDLYELASLGDGKATAVKIPDIITSE